MKLLATLGGGLRSALLRPPRTNPADASPGLFIALIPIYLGVSIAIGMIDAPRPWMLLPSGIVTVLTDSMLTLVAAWIVTGIMGRPGVVWGAASLLLAATIATALVVHLPLSHVALALAHRGHPVIALLVVFVLRWWWLLVLIVFAHAIASGGVGRAALAGALAFAVSAASWWWLPPSPVLTTMIATSAPSTSSAPPVAADADSGADAAAAAPAPAAFDAEAVMYDQSAQVDRAIKALRPETPGKIDLYVVAFAGDAEENVFRNEAEYAERLFAERFDAKGRGIVLENSPATVATRPLATLTNLVASLDGVARTMNPSEDVLLVYLTTHGSADHELLVDLDPLPLDQIEPQDLADAIETEPGVRWKVVVVNACYSGGFIGALRDDSTMVITSARSDRTSFGCGADSDITYFGKAFLAEALNRTTSIPEAFEIARRSVSKWEDADHEEHSEPQIASTRSIEARLEALRHGLKNEAEVPFAPVASTR